MINENNAQRPNRVIHLTGATNFRDFGGYFNSNEQQVKWKMLYRSDELTRLDDDDIAKVRSLGLNRIIDLRQQPEIDQNGLDKTYSGREQKYDFIPYVFGDPYLMESGAQPGLEWDVNQIDFDSLYINILEHNKEGIRQAFERFVHFAQYPLLLHCTQGKDRSGVLSALVLLLLDIPESVVMADYLITDQLTNIERGMQAIQGYLETFKDTIPEGITAQDWRPMLSCQPQALVNMFAYLRTEYNGITRFLDSVGITLNQQQAIREIPLEK